MWIGIGNTISYDARNIATYEVWCFAGKQLVDKLVVCVIMSSMKTIQIGAFDAKTHFSELLQDVLKGKSFEILRRGKPVAHLTSIRGADNSSVAREALDYLRNLRRTISVSRAEVRKWINEGRS